MMKYESFGDTSYVDFDMWTIYPGKKSMKSS